MCRIFLSFFFFYLDLQIFAEEQSDTTARRSVCHSSEGARDLCTTQHFRVPYYAEHFSVHPLRDASQGPTEGRDDADTSVNLQRVDKRCSSRRYAALQASGSSSTLSFCLPGLSFPARRSITSVLLLSAQRASWGQRDVFWKSTAQRGDFRLFDARTLLPSLRPVHLEGDAPAACNMQPKRSKKKNMRPRRVPRMRSFYNAADFCCPFNSDFISHGIADSQKAARLAPSILRAFSVIKPRVSE